MDCNFCFGTGVYETNDITTHCPRHCVSDKTLKQDIEMKEFTDPYTAVKTIARESGYDEGKALQKSIQRRVTQEVGDQLIANGWAEHSHNALWLTKRGFAEGCRLNG